jgi:predicted ArsR family transcriptional regulator
MTDERSEAARPDRLAAISGLGEPTRRALYEHVAAAGEWVSRDAAADAVGIERATAAHHLDRLAADGLLDVDYQRLSGRQGPGAGRPAKLYRRAGRDFDVALPPRDYALAGRLLAEAVDLSLTEGTEITDALDDVASAEGRRLAEDIGFEPRPVDDGTIVLRNCPFHQLAQQHTDLICGMNLCLLKAAIDNVDEAGLEAQLEPEEGRCCVTLHPTR